MHAWSPNFGVLLRADVHLESLFDRIYDCVLRSPDLSQQDDSREVPGIIAFTDPNLQATPLMQVNTTKYKFSW